MKPESLLYGDLAEAAETGVEAEAGAPGEGAAAGSCWYCEGRYSDVVAMSVSFCGSSRRSRTSGRSSASADVTLAMGGNFGGMAEEPEEDCGRPSAAGEVSGKNDVWPPPGVAPLWGELRSGIGEEGFEFPRRWNLKWESIVLCRVEDPMVMVCLLQESCVWSAGEQNWRVTSWGSSICKAPWHASWVGQWRGESKSVAAKID
jgi:hypothetical protein